MLKQLRITELSVSPLVAAKLEAKHGISVPEVETVIFGPVAHIRRGRAGLYLVYGRTAAGRYLFVVIGIRRTKARVITARDMTRKERRLYAKSKRG